MDLENQNPNHYRDKNQSPKNHSQTVHEHDGVLGTALHPVNRTDTGTVQHSSLQPARHTPSFQNQVAPTPLTKPLNSRNSTPNTCSGAPDSVQDTLKSKNTSTEAPAPEEGPDDLLQTAVPPKITSPELVPPVPLVDVFGRTFRLVDVLNPKSLTAAQSPPPGAHLPTHTTARDSVAIHDQSSKAPAQGVSPSTPSAHHSTSTAARDSPALAARSTSARNAPASTSTPASSPLKIVLPARSTAARNAPASTSTPASSPLKIVLPARRDVRRDKGLTFVRKSKPMFSKAQTRGAPSTEACTSASTSASLNRLPRARGDASPGESNALRDFTPGPVGVLGAPPPEAFGAESAAAWAERERALLGLGLVGRPERLGEDGAGMSKRTSENSGEGGAPVPESARTEGEGGEKWPGRSGLRVYCGQPNTAPTAAYAALLVDAFGPGSVLRGEGPKPGRVNTDARPASGEGREKKRRKVTMTIMGRSASEAVSVSETDDSVEDEVNPEVMASRVRAWIAEIQVVVKGKREIERKTLKSLRDTLDVIADMSEAEGAALGEEGPRLKESLAQLATLEDIPFGDEHGVRGWARRLVKGWPQ
ncbi:hypothetical protein K438DRAFT_1807478 [Mycena galopus ATCC 62051]|nr:hypothetical protein K438DRAFT_1807478 [Mycena galopus ATCC 62051]